MSREHPEGDLKYLVTKTLFKTLNDPDTHELVRLLLPYAKDRKIVLPLDTAPEDAVEWILSLAIDYDTNSIILEAEDPADYELSAKERQGTMLLKAKLECGHEECIERRARAKEKREGSGE